VAHDNQDIAPEEDSLHEDATKWQLQFVSAPHPEGGWELFLVRYVGDSEQCQYRANREWLDVTQCHHEDAWFFLIPPGDDLSYFDYSQEDESSVGVEVGYLVDQAVEWYDNPAKRSGLAYEIFGIQEQQLFVQRKFGNLNFQVQLATQGILWKRTSKGQWILEDKLSLRERFQRSVLIEQAENLLREAPASRSSPPAGETAIDLQTAAAIASGAPIQVVPTFDELLFRRVEQSKLTWDSVCPLLACSAEVWLVGDEATDETRGLVVQSGSRTWLRHRASWIPVNWKEGHKRRLQPLGVDNLVEAVNWWDSAGSVSGKRSTPPKFSDSSIQFVSDDDPNEVPDFSIRDLVRGTMDTGYGEARRSGTWQHGYWRALDFENHMPADEGDRSPCGGEHLYSIGKSLQVFAVDFWDQHSEESPKKTQQLTASDFAQWIASQP
jgi:hypothetical protein